VKGSSGLCDRRVALGQSTIDKRPGVILAARLRLSAKQMIPVGISSGGVGCAGALGGDVEILSWGGVRVISGGVYGAGGTWDVGHGKVLVRVSEMLAKMPDGGNRSWRH
jgi:hypothetical protein